MLMFTLAISCLTTFNLPWLMDLTFQVPMKYCSLQHQILLSPPVVVQLRPQDCSMPGLLKLMSLSQCCHPTISSSVHNWVLFLLWPSLILLELFLCSSPVAYWRPTDLGGLIFQCHIFLPFHTLQGALKARMLKWFGIPFSSRPHFVRPWLAETCPPASPHSWKICPVPWLSHCWPSLSV